MSKLLLPELGEGIKKATIACWHKNIGDQIQTDEDVVEIVTDKATFSVCAQSTGRLKQIFYKEGQEANIGDVLAVIEPLS